MPNPIPAVGPISSGLRAYVGMSYREADVRKVV